MVINQVDERYSLVKDFGCDVAVEFHESPSRADETLVCGRDYGLSSALDVRVGGNFQSHDSIDVGHDVLHSLVGGIIDGDFFFDGGQNDVGGFLKAGKEI